MSAMMKIARIATVFALGLFSTAGQAAEANAIKQVQVRKDGETVLVKVELRNPLQAAPATWSVVDPARIVLDFADTENQTGQASQQAAVGDLKSVNIVQSEKLTRVVLNLYRNTKYSTDVNGKSVIVKLETNPGSAAAEQSPVPVAAKEKLVEPSQGPATAVRDIVFRRGDDGQGQIILELNDGNIPIDVRREGTGLMVDLPETELPDRLQSRRDVNDFATPVNFITSRTVGNMARIEIGAKGRWFHQAQLANNQLTIEIKPIPEDDANKLVPTGQQGQKVSINFFDADSSMVLRTLAEISGKNVMVDPSLAGRRITVNLENIPYDQALDIVMSQVNAGMRISNEIVLFGDRAVLRQRDTDKLLDKLRADETAPLVSETFKLSYIPVAQAQALIVRTLATSAIANTSNASQAGQGQAAAQPAAQGQQGQGGAGGQGAGGFLSSRGLFLADAPSNKLFVTDIASVIEKIREIIREVDVPPTQVMIEARIVEAGTGFTNSLGARLKFFDAGMTSRGGYNVPLASESTRFALGSPSTTGLSNVDAFGAPAVPSLIRTTTQGFASNLGLAGSTAINLMLFNSAATKLLTLELQAAESDSKNRTISSPRIVTLNRKAATINNTQTVVLPAGINPTTGQTIWQTTSAPLNLTVTPSVNPDSRISLELNIAKSTITNPSTGSVDSNTITTSVIVENGGTVVIGGFTRESEIESQERVPLLADIPAVGNLFKSTTRNRTRGELLVFITPRLVTDKLVQQR